MEGSVSAELVEKLAYLAGYELAVQRCALLAPQLEWLLAEGAPIRDLPMLASSRSQFSARRSLARNGQEEYRDA